MCTSRLLPVILISSILGDPGAASQDDSMFSGEILLQEPKGDRALFLSNQFQKSSNSVPLIGQKNIFLANQRGGPPGRLCRLLTRRGFHRFCLARTKGRFSGRVSEKRSTKPGKLQAVALTLGNNTSRSIFTADSSKVYR